MKKSILVTGGAGFIGSNLVDRLVSEGFKTVVVDNLSTGKAENLNPEAKFYREDIRDRKALDRIFEIEEPAYVNHHSAQRDVRKSVSAPGFDAETNIIGSINLMEASRASGVRKFVYISTGGAIYGEPGELPASENCPVRPISAYGVSKHAAEHYLYFYRHNFGMEYTVLRYANVYGPRQDPLGEAGVVAIFLNRISAGEKPVIYGSGEQTRDYIFVDDVVNANMLAMESGGGEIYNIGTGTQTSVNEVFRALSDITGFKGGAVYAGQRKGEVDKICLDSRKAEAELGWEAKRSLEDGLRETAAALKK